MAYGFVPTNQMNKDPNTTYYAYFTFRERNAQYFGSERDSITYTTQFSYTGRNSWWVPLILVPKPSESDIG